MKRHREWGAEIAKRLGVTQQDGIKIIRTVSAIAEDELVAGRLVGFGGAFVVRVERRAATRVRHPTQPGQKVDVPSKLTLRVRTSDLLNARLNPDLAGA